MAWQLKYGGEDGTTPYWTDPVTGANSMTPQTGDTPNFQTRPTANGGLETLDPTTGQWGPSYRVPNGGMSFVPERLAAQYGASLQNTNSPASNFDIMDTVIPLVAGGIATAGIGNMLGAGSLFGGGASPNALTDAVGGGAYSPNSANALTDALTRGYNSGTAIGASGAGTQLAGAIPAAEAGAATALGSAPGMTAAQYAGDIGSGAFPTGSAAAGMGAGGGFKLPAWMDAIKPYTPLIGGALSAGGALLGAGQISNATRDAAALSSDAAARSTALQERMFEQNQANQAPYLAAGRNALGRITTGMAPGGEFSKSFSMDDFTADPGYGFRMSEGLKAMDRNAAARGGLISGAALKAGTRYGQDMASQEYTNAFNRYQTNRGNQLAPLQSLAGIGQTTVNNLANAGSNYASNVGNIGTNAANTQANAGLTANQAYASAYGAAGNALNNALNPNPVLAYLQSLGKTGVTG